MQTEITKLEIRRSILEFSWPIVVELMLMSMITMVNLSMVGHLGAYALSAVGLTSQPVFIGIAVFQSLNIGATALISRYIGAEEYVEAKAVVIQTLLLSIIFGLFVSIICFVFSRELVLLMGAQPDTVDPADMYMKYMAVGMILQSVPSAVASILRGTGESKVPMRFNVASNIVNVVVGYCMIYGFAFLPALGLEGAAIAATIAKLTACIMSVYAVMRCNLAVSLKHLDDFWPDVKVIRKILNIGISAAGESFAMRIGFLIYTRIIADLGTASLASHQVILSITGFASNIISGLATAASSFTGRNLGMGKPELAEEYCTEIRRIGLIISTSIGILFFTVGYQIASLFTSDVSVLVISAFVLKIAAVITFPQNSLMIVSGALRGAGDTRWPLISSLVGMIVARVSMAAVFVKVFHLGLGGAWAAALLDQSVRSFLINIRYKTGKWKNIKI